MALGCPGSLREVTSDIRHQNVKKAGTLIGRKVNAYLARMTGSRRYLPATYITKLEREKFEGFEGHTLALLHPSPLMVIFAKGPSDEGRVEHEGGA